MLHLNNRQSNHLKKKIVQPPVSLASEEFSKRIFIEKKSDKAVTAVHSKKKETITNKSKSGYFTAVPRVF